jgi:pSer/pThr/pTyr-binding forkhead associated (FHA) protein
MAKLVLSLDGKVVNHFFIEKTNITIGRGAENDIAIDDPLLNPVHASIVKLGRDAIVEDLKSQNGSRINGKPLAKHILHHRDIIELGRHQLRYMSAEIAADSDLDRTMLIQTARPSGAGMDATIIDTPLTPSANVKLAPGRVEVVDGPAPHAAGQVVPLERVVTTFGTPGEALIVLTRRPQGVFLSHVEGKQNPRVNRQLINKAPYALKADDLIEAAGYKLKFKP